MQQQAQPAPVTSTAAPSSTPPSTAPAGDAQALYGNAFVADQVRMEASSADGDGHQAADFATAIKEHCAHAAVVDQVIQKGLAIPEPTGDKLTLDHDMLLRNAAQWVKEGETKLRVLSSTHDALTRKKGMMAVFDNTKSWPDKTGTYSTTSDAGIDYVKPGTHGEMHEGGDVVDFINPSSAQAVEATLIHEIQHDADQTWAGQAWREGPDADTLKAAPADKVDELTNTWNNYKSEFRAFSIMGDDGSGKTNFGSSKDKAKNTAFYHWNTQLSPTDDYHTPSFQNQRQENIFQYMVGNGYGSVAYWYVMNPGFKKMCDSYTLPDSGNLIDSVRIQHLSEAVAGCTPAMTADDAAVKAVQTAAGGLEKADRQYLAAKTYSAPFWKQAQAALSADVQKQLDGSIAGKTTVAASTATQNPDPQAQSMPPPVRD